MSLSEVSALVRPVVVGVDGSAASRAAVEVAAGEAARRGRPLRLVHALAFPLGPPPLGPPVGGLEAAGDRLLAGARLRAGRGAPRPAVAGDLVAGRAATVLLDAARTAELVVVGGRDPGAAGWSVAEELAMHAACPVVVVPERPAATGPVVVGVDGSPAGDPAVGFAFEEAALRGVPLVALHAWTHPVAAGPGDMLPPVFDVAMAQAEEARVLAEALAGRRERYPAVAVRRETVRAGARRALVAAAGRAQLLVVGTRGHGGFAGLLLGSVSRAVLHHAPCPVAVVPHRHRS